MDVKRKLTYIFRLCLPLLLLLNACDDMEDKPFTSSDITGDPTETDTAELYALCEGLFNQNNSSLMFGNPLFLSYWKRWLQYISCYRKLPDH